MSNKLYKNFGAQAKEMDEILREYHHILEHDNFDCTDHISGKDFIFKCWFRRFGCPIACLILFIAYSAFKIYRVLN